ncbi:MAG: C4-dicarboxylate ABC transporter [Betaproteobacteria bacterium RIFCSPLOWO2_02_FULL_63_19]|nr:MAG: C4-dicarboxylate ABC transporter [Betaproteobacteria bacterium RIFCSPLOWO2_02_FULL_63_19]
MSPLETGVFGLGAILVLLALRVPVGLALGMVSFLGIWKINGLATAAGTIAILPYDFIAHWTLSAVPMFLLMGAIVYYSGVTSSLFRAARLWLAGLPGGLAVATNMACAGFAAASGSSLATASAMAKIATPEMLRYRYDPGLATGVVASGGTLGSLIPPSILFVLYGIFAEESVSALLIAGILPGLLTAAFYTVMIVIRCKLDPSLAPPVLERVSWSAKFSALRDIWPFPLLILGVIGGIYSGVTTVTEAGAFGALLAFVIALVMGKSGLGNMRAAVLEAVSSTANIFFIAAGAIMLTRFLVLTGLPFALSDVVTAYSNSQWTVLAFTTVIYLVLGSFLDPVGIMLLTLPLLLPMFDAFKMDGIWMGVLVVKFLEIGLLTPPVGLNVFAVRTAVDVPIATIFRGVGWFLVCEIFIVLCLMVWPEISLFLPNLATTR